MSTSLLCLFVGQDGPTTIGLNLRSLVSQTAIHFDLCFNCYFNFFRICGFFVISKSS